LTRSLKAPGFIQPSKLKCDLLVSRLCFHKCQLVPLQYGHLNSCNHVSFNVRGDTIASCDADGGAGYKLNSVDP
jgi:hypothetical protein